MLPTEPVPGNGEREAHRVGELDFSLQLFPERTQNLGGNFR